VTGDGPRDSAVEKLRREHARDDPIDEEFE
jgi:hypothetical protein